MSILQLDQELIDLNRAIDNAVGYGDYNEADHHERQLWNVEQKIDESHSEAELYSDNY